MRFVSSITEAQKKQLEIDFCQPRPIRRQPMLICPAYQGSKHWLHQAYHRGWKAGTQRDEYCPHVCGTKEWEWWWAGWGDGRCAKN